MSGWVVQDDALEGAAEEAADDAADDAAEGEASAAEGTGGNRRRPFTQLVRAVRPRPRCPAKKPTSTSPADNSLVRISGWLYH